MSLPLYTKPATEEKYMYKKAARQTALHVCLAALHDLSILQYQPKKQEVILLNLDLSAGTCLLQANSAFRPPWGSINE